MRVFGTGGEETRPRPGSGAQGGDSVNAPPRAAHVGLVGLLALASIVTQPACSSGGGGGGGGTSTGNPAVDAVTQAVINELLSGDAMLTNPALFVTSTFNPFAFPPAAASTTVSLTSTMPNDGTATSVTVFGTFTLNVDNTITIETSIVDDANGFVYLMEEVNASKPSISFRGVPNGFAALAADGTGQAFVMMEVSGSASYTRSFTNQNTNSSTLITFDQDHPAPTSTVEVGTIEGAARFLTEFQITLNQITGLPEARVAAFDPFPGLSVRFDRVGGPVITAVRPVLSNIVVDGQMFTTDLDDLFIPVGDDLLAGGVSPTGTFSYDLDVEGGAGAALVAAQFDGSGFDPASYFTLSFPTSTSGALQLDNPTGGVDLDMGGQVGAFAFERIIEFSDMSGSPTHSIEALGDGDTTPALGFSQAVYPSSFSTFGNRIYLFR